MKTLVPIVRRRCEEKRNRNVGTALATIKIIRTETAETKVEARAASMVITAVTVRAADGAMSLSGRDSRFWEYF